MATADWGDCTLSECSIQLSVFKYRPSLAANSVFIALFGLSLVIHAFQGVKYRQWTFGVLMLLGCACEMIGYGGRIIMYNDPWSFSGFIMQIGNSHASMTRSLYAYYISSLHHHCSRVHDSSYLRHLVQEVGRRRRSGPSSSAS